MQTYVDLVLRHRLKVLATLLGISVLSALVLPSGVVASEPKKMFFGDSPAYAAYLERARTFANDELVAIGVAVEDPFAPETLRKLAAATERLEALPDVNRVDSLASAQLVRGSAGMLRIDGVADLLEAEPERADEVRAAILEDPLYRNLVVSPDGQATALLVELTVDEGRQAETLPQFVEAVAQAMVEAGFSRDQVHLAGLVAVSSECVALAFETLQLLTPAVLLVLLGVVWWLFRRLWPVVVTGGVALLGTLWTMAFAILLDPQISIMLSMVPAVILIISFSDVVHLCSAYLTLLGDGLDKEAAIRGAGAEVGTACLLTSVTTFCGFAAMTLVPTPMFQQLGVVLGFGVGVALLIAITLAPVLFSFFPEPQPADKGTHSGRLVQWVVDQAMNLSLGHPWKVLTGFAALGVFCAYGISQLTIEARMEDRLADDNPTAVASKFFETHFAGQQPADLVLTADQDGGLRDPAFLKRLSGFQLELAARPGFGPVRSIVDVLARIHRELNPDLPAPVAGTPPPLPTTVPMVAQYLLLFEMSGGAGLERLADHDGRTARVAITVQETGFRAVAGAANEAATLARARLGDGVQVEITSVVHLFGEWLTHIIAGQRRGLLLSSLVICLVMIIGLRSFRAGVWSMVPNLLPLFTVGAVVALLYDEVDSDTLPVAMIALGIGVDDTVHFLTRLRLEFARTPDLEEAVRNTFRFAGIPIVLTTMILSLGFAPMASSDYYSLTIMGTLLPLSLIVALLADLLLVPALVQVGALRFGPARG